MEWIAERAEAEFLLKTDDDDAWPIFGFLTQDACSTVDVEQPRSVDEAA